MNRHPDAVELDRRGSTAPLLTEVRPVLRLLRTPTLRRHRRIIYLREWLAAQSPWRRRLASRVSERIRAA